MKSFGLERRWAGRHGSVERAKAALEARGDKSIVRADRSPMNAKQWCCELECGHETWITQSRQPQVGKRVSCERCASASKEKP